MKIDFTSEEIATIDDYLNNELKGAALIDFEKKLSSNTELQDKVKELSLIKLAIEEVGLEKELNIFYSEHNQQSYRQEQKSRKRYSFKLIGIAASLALIIGFSLYLFLYQKKQSLYASYYKPDPGLMTVMGYSDYYDFEKAMVEYKNGDYTSAINVWQKQLKTQANNDTLLYFLGAAYQAKGKLDSAEVFLNKVTNLPQSTFYGEANWYLGLIYLRKDQKEKAIDYLKKSNNINIEILIPLIKK